MPPNHATEQVDFQVNNVERHEDTPDLYVEYGQERISLFGIEGTVDELRKMCPYAGQIENGEIDRDKENQFIIRALNESGNSVKAEHYSYISEKLTDMGLEVKITVKEEIPREEDQHEHAERKSDETVKVSDRPRRERVTSDIALPSEPKIRSEDAVTDTRSRIDTVTPDTPIQTDPVTRIVSESLVDEDQEVDVETWFEVMAVEYAEYQQRHAQESGSETDDIVAVSEEVKKSTPVRLEEAPKRPLERSDSPKEVVPTLVEIVPPEQPLDSALEINPGDTEDAEGSKAAIGLDETHDASRVFERAAPDDEILGDEVSAGDQRDVAENDVDVEVVSDVSISEVIQDDEGAEEGIESADYLESMPVDEIELPEVLSDLFIQPDDEVGHGVAEGVDIQGAEPTEEAVSLEADQEFIAQIEAYITQLEAVEATNSGMAEVIVDEVELADETKLIDDIEQVDAYPQPRQAFVQVLELAQQIQTHRTEIAVAEEGYTDSGSDPEQLAKMQEAQETLEAELYEVCEQFLESIGVEPTEEKVRALVERVIKIGFETLEKEQKFSIQQLAKMGTREYKHDDSWFKRTMAHAKVSPWQIVGTFAVRHVSVDYV